jgi:hypothetical protein
MVIRIKSNGKHTQIIVPGDAGDLSDEIKLKVIERFASDLSRKYGGVEEIELVDESDETK